LGKTSATAGFTLVELMVSLTILALVLALSAVEFPQVWSHFSRSSQQLDAERTARVVMTRVTDEFRQAMPDQTDNPTSQQPIVSPLCPGTCQPSDQTGSQDTSVAFYRARDLRGSPGSIPVTNGRPTPAYDRVIISYDAASRHLNQYVVAASFVGPSPAPEVIGQNVTNFVVTPKGSEYQFDLTVTSPPSGNQSTAQSFKLTSSVYVSYYP
jgi:prepilin-type N-terminal cleavage/methylation domain-containing protein